MYINKKLIFICMVLLLGLQAYACDNGKQKELNVEINTNLPVKKKVSQEKNSVKYTEMLPEIFNPKVKALSKNVYFYKDKIYFDYTIEDDEKCQWENSKYIRIVLGWQGEKAFLADMIELPATWDGKSCGSENYMVAGDHYGQWIQVHDLDTGDIEYITAELNKVIDKWELQDGILYYCVLDGKNEENTSSLELHVKELSLGQENVIYCNAQISKVYFMSVNKQGDVGLIYDDNACEERLGIIHEGQIYEVDTSNLEIWNVDRKEHHCFQLTDSGKMMMSTEDVSHTIVSIPAWNCSYEIYPDGEWNYIPYQLDESHILGYVHNFYYLDDCYLVYWDKRNFASQYGKVVLCNTKGECCGMFDQISTTSVYLAYTNDTVYIISITGNTIEQFSVEVNKIYYK